MALDTTINRNSIDKSIICRDIGYFSHRLVAVDPNQKKEVVLL
jgi:hypothetical protein